MIYCFLLIITALFLAFLQKWIGSLTLFFYFNICRWFFVKITGEVYRFLGDYFIYFIFKYYIYSLFVRYMWCTLTRDVNSEKSIISNHRKIINKTNFLCSIEDNYIHNVKGGNKELFTWKFNIATRYVLWECNFPRTKGDISTYLFCLARATRNTQSSNDG